MECQLKRDLGSSQVSLLMTPVKPALKWLGMNQREVDPHTLGGRIRECREEFGWSQDDLGLKFKISGSAISQWETNVITPRPSKIARMAEMFSVSLSWLMAGIGPKKSNHSGGGAAGRGVDPGQPPGFRGAHTAVQANPGRPRNNVRRKKRPAA